VTHGQELTESALLVHECLAAVHLLTALQIHLDSRAARLPIDAPTLRRAVHKFTRETLPAAIESLDVAATHGASPGNPRGLGYHPSKDCLLAASD
jgi:hypothetical protein